jgi:hypothetical protein
MRPAVIEAPGSHVSAMYIAAARPYEAWLQVGPDGRQVWTISSGEDTRDQAIRGAQAAGITSQRQIAKRTGIPPPSRSDRGDFPKPPAHPRWRERQAFARRRCPSRPS